MTCRYGNVLQMLKSSAENGENAAAVSSLLTLPISMSYHSGSNELRRI